VAPVPDVVIAGYGPGRPARRRVRRGPGPAGAAPRPAAGRRGGHGHVPRLGRRGRAHRPGAVHRRRPGHAL